MLIKCVLNHYVFQLFIRRQRKSRNVFEDKVFYVLVINCLILVQILVVLTCIMYQSNFGDSQSFFGLDASFCQDV